MIFKLVLATYKIALVETRPHPIPLMYGAPMCPVKGQLTKLLKETSNGTLTKKEIHFVITVL